MAGALANRIAIVTGAGQGIGRQHALRFAAEGAAVVVNDLDGAPAVVEEIEASGGRAVASTADVSSRSAAEGLIASALDAYGRLDALVNNAGVASGLDPIGSISEEAFDRELRVNLKGTWCPMEAAVAYWARERRAGRDVRASVVNTTSGAGLLGNPGQSIYGAAKAGVAALTVIAATELAETGVRVNAIAPAARTPMSGEGSDSIVARAMRPPAAPAAFDAWHPANVSPLVAYLATANCEVSGRVFHVRGGVVGLFEGWTIPRIEERHRSWTIAELAERIPDMLTQAADPSEAGGTAYAALRASLGTRSSAQESGA